MHNYFSPSDEYKAEEFLASRVMKLNKVKGDYKERYDQLAAKNQKGKCDTHLHINVFDEAHFGNSTDKNTAYQLYANSWNSDDHPRVVNLLVTATPWNLLTTSTKLEKTRVTKELDEQGNEKICRVDDDQVTRRKGVNSYSLHEINWQLSYGDAFSKGKLVRLKVLMVSHNFSSFVDPYLLICRR